MKSKKEMDAKAAELMGELKRGQHTPTPWTYEIDADESVIFHEDIATIARLPDDLMNHADNAVYIVKCVNAHEELLRIAKAYRNLLKTMASTDDEVLTFHHIEKVIAKVEQGGL